MELELLKKAQEVFEQSGLKSFIIFTIFSIIIILTYYMSKLLYRYIKHKIEKIDIIKDKLENKIEEIKKEIDEIQETVAAIAAKIDGQMSFSGTLQKHEIRLAVQDEKLVTQNEKLNTIFRIIDRRKKSMPVKNERRKK